MFIFIVLYFTFISLSKLRHSVFRFICLLQLVTFILKLEFSGIFLRSFLIAFLFFSVSYLPIHIRLRINISFLWQFGLKLCVPSGLSVVVVHIVTSIIRSISSNSTFYFFISSIVFSYKISSISTQIIWRRIAVIFKSFILILLLIFIILAILWLFRIRLRFSNFICFKILSQIKTLLSSQSWRFIVRTKRICKLLPSISILSVILIIITSTIFFFLQIFTLHMHRTISSVAIWTSLVFIFYIHSLIILL